MQYLIGYNILLRINRFQNKESLPKCRLRKYCETIDKLLKLIEDKYILEQKFISNNYKLFALSKKYNKDLRYDIKYENNSFFYLGNVIIDLKKENNIITWRILDIKNNILHLEGVDNFLLPREKYFYFCKLDNQIFFPKYHYYCSNYDFETIFGIIKKGRIIVFDIPLGVTNSTKMLEFYFSYKDFNIEIFPSLGMFSHIPPISNGYYISHNKIIKYINRRITIFSYNKKLSFEFEKLYCDELHRLKKDHFINLRKRYLNITKNYEIWLINDRRDRAGDNGEYFFRYIKSKQLKTIKAYFVIEGNSSDYKRLKKFGDVLDVDSDIYCKFEYFS